MKKIRLLILSLGAMTVLTGLVLVALEIYLRFTATYIVQQEAKSFSSSIETDPAFLIMHTDKGKRLRPNANAIIRNHFLSKKDILVKTNSLGFRDEELKKAKGGSEMRILVLGDSIVYGDSMNADKVFVQRMEYYLNESIKDKKIEVVNAGVGDIGIKEEIDILEEKGLSIEPDIVVLAFYLNDSRPPWGFTEELGYRGFLRRHSLLAETIYRNLKLQGFIKDKGIDRAAWWRYVDQLDWIKDRQAFLELAAKAKLDWGAAWNADSWNTIDDELFRLKSLSEKYNFQVIVVSFPVIYQIMADFVEDTPQQVMREKAASLGFDYFDLLPILRESYNGKWEDIYYDHVHPNETGNEIIGSKLADFIERELLSHFTSPG